MAPAPTDSPYREWASATDLAEYAYCPRAWYYRAHTSPEERTRESRRSEDAGAAYHARALDRAWDQERHGGRYLLLLALGVALALGGILWIFW